MESDRSLAEQRVKGPAIGLIVTGILGAVLEIAGVVLNVLWAGSSPFADRDERLFVFFTGTWGAIGSVIGAAVAGFIVWAALKMMRLEGLPLAFVACVLALIPCLSPCCVITLPFGIWGLIVLNDPVVKRAFEAAGAPGPPSGSPA